MKISFKADEQKWFRPAFWGLVLVLTAVILVLDGLGIPFGYGVDAWRIIVGILLLAWLGYTLFRKHFADIFIPLAILFLVFEAPIAHAMGKADENLISNWTVILAALLLTIGFNIILKPFRTVTINGKEYEKVNGNQESSKFGSQAIYLDGEKLNGAVIRDHLGSVQIYIKNAASYSGGAVVTISDNLGKIIVHIPNEWDVISQSSNNLGNVSIPAHTGNGEKNITLVIKDNTGSIQVEFDQK